jgi:hypothetical protein
LSDAYPSADGPVLEMCCMTGTFDVERLILRRRGR